MGESVPMPSQTPLTAGQRADATLEQWSLTDDAAPTLKELIVQAIRDAEQAARLAERNRVDTVLDSPILFDWPKDLDAAGRAAFGLGLQAARDELKKMLWLGVRIDEVKP